MRHRVAIIGLYRSGSSVLASLLEHLGVSMGAPFFYRHYESTEVANVLRQWWKEPLDEESEPVENRIRWLRKWIERQEARTSASCGVKHPLLCSRPDDVIEAWGNSTKLIWAYRPLEECVNSLIEQAWSNFKGHEERIQNSLSRKINDFFGRKQHLRIDNSDLRRDPLQQVAKVVDFLDLSPDAETLSTAFKSLSKRH